MLLSFSIPIKAQDCKAIIKDLDDRLAVIEQRNLQGKREIVINQVCSRCKRTKSQIEYQEGISYSKHLSIVQGVNEVSQYTRLDASTTLEDHYQSELESLEAQKLQYLKICGDLNNKNYLNKTSAYQQQNSRVQDRTVALQQLANDKPGYNPHAADEISLVSATEVGKSSYKCNEGVRTNPAIIAALEQIISRLNSEGFSINLTITSGERDERAQAEAMFRLAEQNLVKWYKARDLHTKKYLVQDFIDALEEVNQAYPTIDKLFSDLWRYEDYKKNPKKYINFTNAEMVKINDSTVVNVKTGETFIPMPSNPGETIISKLTQTLVKQTSGNPPQFISHHLAGLAFDIGLNSSKISSSDKLILLKIIKDLGYKSKDESVDGNPCLHVRIK